MVRLRNIEKNSASITCDIIPEDSKLAGFLSVDYNTEEMTYQLPEGYE